MAAAPDTLRALLKREHALLLRLTELLRQEQRALVSGEVDALGAYAEPKSALLLDLSRCGDERSRLLASHGLQNNTSGMEQLLRKQGSGATELVDEWQRLLNDTRAARHMNDTNGTLIAARMRSTQQALGVLLGAARIPGTYGADGSTVGLHSAHRLAVV